MLPYFLPCSRAGFIIQIFGSVDQEIRTCENYLQTRKSACGHFKKSISIYFISLILQCHKSKCAPVQFIAASDKFWFMVELYSFVDYFTIPPSFVSIYLDRTWIGSLFPFLYSSCQKLKSHPPTLEEGNTVQGGKQSLMLNLHTTFCT